MNPPATDGTKPVKKFQVGTSSSSRTRSVLLIDTAVLADSWHELDGTPWFEYILEHCRARTMVSSFLGCSSVRYQLSRAVAKCVRSPPGSGRTQ